MGRIAFLSSMKSPRCESSSSPIGRFERDRLLGDLENLAHFFERHGKTFGQLFRRRLAADLVQHLARRAHQLVDGLDHVDGNADGARLIGDRARDRLPDPPGGVGREFVAAAVFELIDRLHQADIAFLDEIEELQAAIGVFLGDRDHETQVRLDHFLLRLAASRSPFCTVCTMRRKSAIDWRVSCASVWISSRRSRTLSFSSCAKSFQPGPRQTSDAAQPVRIELVAEILLQEIHAIDAARFGQAQDLAFERAADGG